MGENDLETETVTAYISLFLTLDHLDETRRKIKLNSKWLTSCKV